MKGFAIFVFVLFITDVLSNSEEWTNFKEKFGRTYKSVIEEQRRYSIFQDNLKRIDAHNQDYRNKKTSYYMGVNQFADMTQEEFTQQLGTANERNVSESSTMMNIPYHADLPESVDWNKKGAVTPVIDQGDCGSCYIFASMGSIESQHFLKTGKLITLSAQQFLDCDSYNNKCSGGWAQSTYEFIRDHGAVLEEDYRAYDANVGECKATGTLFLGMGYISVARNEEDLKTAVATVGPVATAVDATSFFLYAGGVFYDQSCSSKFTNHEVLVVGYGNEDGQDYWLVKNSWGTSFGEEGYIKIARNSNNHCAIASKPFLPQFS